MTMWSLDLKLYHFDTRVLSLTRIEGTVVQWRMLGKVISRCQCGEYWHTRNQHIGMVSGKTLRFYWTKKKTSQNVCQTPLPLSKLLSTNFLSKLVNTSWEVVINVSCVALYACGRDIYHGRNCIWNVKSI